VSALTQRDPHELLSRGDISAQYKIGERSQLEWLKANRYGWASICRRIGGRVLVRRHELEAWLEQQRVEPNPNDGATLHFDNSVPPSGTAAKPPPARMSRKRERSRRRA
jgi:hypothetical protein